MLKLTLPKLSLLEVHLRKLDVLTLNFIIEQNNVNAVSLGLAGILLLFTRSQV